jgi:NTE family protein
MSDPRIGLVLGGGGARGFAHVPVLEALDEMGLAPTAIAGTSIGAIYGAARAGGLTGAEIRARTLDIFGNRTAALSKLWSMRPKKLGDLLTGGFGIGQINSEKILEAFVGDALPETFEACAIPLAVVATDFYGGEEVIFSRGSLRPAVAASIALPTLFKPVVIDGRVLVDGGIMNPIPVDALPTEVDVVVAVDVVSFPEPREGRSLPSAMEAIFGSTQLLMQQIATARFERRRPDVLLRPPVNNVRVLDFLDAGKILEETAGVKEELKRKLGLVLEARG